MLNYSEAQINQKLGLVKPPVNHNYLKNAWFKTNTKGQSSYSGSGVIDTAIETIDNFHVDVNSTLEVQEGSIKFVSTAMYSGLSYFIPTSSLENGATYTMSWLWGDNTLTTHSFVFDSSISASSWYDSYLIPNHEGAFWAYRNFSSGITVLYIIDINVANTTHILKAIKLELGSVSTLADETAESYTEDWEWHKANFGFKVGDVYTTARTNLNEDWLLCNGQKFDVNKYPSLADIYKPQLDFSVAPTTTTLSSIPTTIFGSAYCVHTVHRANGYLLAGGEGTPSAYHTCRLAYRKETESSWSYTDVSTCSTTNANMYFDCIRYLNDKWFFITAEYYSGTNSYIRITSMDDLNGTNTYTYTVGLSYAANFAIKQMKYLNGQYFIVCSLRSSTSESAATILKSSDGRSWTKNTILSGSGGSSFVYASVNDICYVPRCNWYIAIGQNSNATSAFYWLSSDGTTWEQHALQTNATAGSVYGCCISYDKNSNSVIMCTTVSGIIYVFVLIPGVSITQYSTNIDAGSSGNVLYATIRNGHAPILYVHNDKKIYQGDCNLSSQTSTTTVSSLTTAYSASIPYVSTYADDDRVYVGSVPSSIGYSGLTFDTKASWTPIIATNSAYNYIKGK